MEPIAIIGIGCRFPGAKSPEAFWQLLRDGVDAITEVPADRWDIDALYDPNPATPGKMNTRWGGFLEQVDQFDAQFFGITPREASSMDPQQRLLLEVAWEAIEDAGLIPERLANTPTGVFVGISCYDYSELIFKAHGPGDPYAGTGNTLCIAANRLSYVFDFRGPSLAVDTACSSSLVAVHLACRSLWQGECTMALAGGVNVILSPQININFTKAGFLANDGRCKTFDARANGYVRSEGAGIVILKPLSQALSDGDSIYAVIRGGAVNQDGRTNGLMAPNRWAQEAVVREAYQQAGVPPSQVQYVEAHGTGTLLGDPIEMKALGAVLGKDRSPGQYCAVGSVKTNIGHLEGAAGIAALIKVALSLKHRQIPPSLHFQKPNPHIPFEELTLRVQQTLEPWPEESSPVNDEVVALRFAGVSSFGFGGTNAHVVLEEAPKISQKAKGKRQKKEAIESPLHLLTLSAKSEKALLELAHSYEVFLAEHSAESIADVCFTANTGRSHFAHRLAIATASTEQLTEQLGAFITGNKPAGLVSGHVKSRKRPQIAFLFTGQGAQYLGMGRQLYDTQPTFRKALERCDELLRPYLEQPLLSVLFPASDDSQMLNHVETLHVTALHTQPALFAFEYALAELWRSWGIVPDIVMGHSLGEYVAACVAGVFSLEDGIKLIAERGRLTQALPQDGMMAAVFADEARVTAAIAQHKSRVAFAKRALCAIAAVNGPENTVISGDRATVEAVLEQLRAEGIDARPLQVSHAFHSPLMEPMLDNFEQVAASVQFAAPRIPLVSNLTGQILSNGEIPDATYWRRHVRETVQFAAGMHTLAEQGYHLFIELGSHPTLLGMGKHCLPPESGTWLPSLRKGQDDWWVLLNSLAALYVKGVDVDWAGFNRDYQRSRVHLPTYPFERQRYWIESTETMDIESADMNAKKSDTKPSHPQVDMTPKITREDTTSKTTQGDSIRSTLRSLVAGWLQIAPDNVDIYASFLEMGADSIILLEAVRSIENSFGVKVEIRLFFEELTTLDALATYIEQNISSQWASKGSPQPELEPSRDAKFRVSTFPSQQPESEPSRLPQQLPQPTAFNPPVAIGTDKAADRQNGRRVPETALEGIIGQQIQLMSQIMSQQLELLRNDGFRTEQPLLAETKPAESRPAESFHQSVPAANAPARVSLQSPITTTASPVSVSAPAQSNQPAAKPSVSAQPTLPEQKGGLSPRQQQYLDTFIARYTKRTQGSKRQKQTYHPVLADKRAASGFRPSIKEMIYPIVGQRSGGCRIWDVDGNEYIDISMGFGVHLFGHAAPFITSAIQERIEEGIQIGPQSNLAGEVAELICELTGMERATFCSTGTEAVMTAIRLARAVTGRTKIAVFAGSYHGQFDGTLVLPALSADGKLYATPRSPGVPPHIVEDTLILKYGDPRALDIIKAHEEELAAVLVEPVQGSRPNLQPKEFLQKLRQLTKAADIALIFDEVVTGFRLHPGGAQAWFGVEADIATYGKVVGGGMPIGVVAGKAAYMNAMDGGAWNYGDESYPQAETIFFAGTFNKNPLSMATTRAVLKHLKEQGPALQQQLNQRTSQLAETLNAYFQQENVPIQMIYCGSLFCFSISGNFTEDYTTIEIDLFFYHLIANGVYTWEGRRFFLSTAHTDEDIDFIIRAVKKSLEEMRSGGFLSKRSPNLPKLGKQSDTAASNPTNSFLAKSSSRETASSQQTNTVPPVSSTETLKVTQVDAQQQPGFWERKTHKPALMSRKPTEIKASRDTSRGMSFSLYYFGNYESEFDPDKYNLLFEGAKFADEHGFTALWVPERHFHAFGGFSPNPSVIGAALARETKRIQIRAGSVVLPLHHPIRVAEEWSVVDNLSKGRVGISFASGWHANDFVFAPESYGNHRELMFQGIETVQKLWRGESIQFRDGAGSNIDVKLFPMPMQPNVPIWITIVNNPDTYIRAGEIGAGVLTNMMGQSIEDLAKNIALYRESLSKHGYDPESGHVTVLLHTFLGNDVDLVREKARQPFYNYLRSTIGLFQNLVKSQGLKVDIDKLSQDDIDYMLSKAYERYVQTSALIGTPNLCFPILENLIAIGVDEIACFVDFGVDPDSVLEGLPHLKSLKEHYKKRDDGVPEKFPSSPKTAFFSGAEANYDGVCIPLTEAQKALWFLAQMGEESSSAYNESIVLQLRGPLNLRAMSRAFGQVVNRHESLRTTFSIQGDFQQILPTLTIDLPLIDYSNLAPTEREAKVSQCLEKESKQCFDLVQGPLFRIQILKLEEQLHLLVFTAHHLIIDDWSFDVLLHDLSMLYSAECQGTPCQLQSPMQFREYMQWQAQQSQSEKMAADEAYWLNRFAGSIPVLELPTDRPRSPKQTNAGASWKGKTLDASLYAGLKRLSQQHGCTLFMTLLAGYFTLLHRLTGQDDIVVGIPVASRSLKNSENLIGYCINLLPVRSHFVGNPIFTEYIDEVKSLWLEAYKHQDYPFATLVEKVNPAREASRSPIVATAFNMQPSAKALPKFFDMEIDLLPSPISHAKFDINLSVIEINNELLVDLDYNSDLFDATTIARMAGHFQTLLENIVAHPEQRLSDLPLLTERERHQILVEWNDTQANYPKDKCIDQLFEAQVERSPDAVAVVFDGQILTYRELNSRANKIAHHLQALGVKPEVLVGICVERSLEMVVGLLGILKAGGAYMPLDPAYPKERLAFMLQDAAVPVLLTQQRLSGGLPEHGAKLVFLDSDIEALAQESEQNPESGVKAQNLAYVIYTSGSTGLPKGVEIEHRGLLNLVCWHQQAFSVSPCDRATLLAGPAFDASVWELWPYLAAGASINIPDEQTRVSPVQLQQWLNASAITIAFLPTPLAESVLSLDWPSELALRTMLTGGDKLHNYPRLGLPFELVNNYGPTENTVVTTSGLVAPQQQADTTPAIGRPIANTQVYLLDEQMQPVPVGVSGELYIGGDGLARGYLNRPDLTEEKFISNPFSAEPGARLYKTGDLARYLPDGNIEYLGRIDHQVKIRGFRIELGEIEAVLGQHPDVLQTVVIAREDVPGDKRLVAYLVPKEHAPTISQLRNFLKQQLPEYMVPAAIVMLDTLPLTPNGKVDRQALPAPELRPELSPTFVAPRTPIEEMLAAIWAEVLGVKLVGIHDNFFELGGHSLLVPQLIFRVQDTFSVELPVRCLFESPTVAGIAQSIDIIRQAGTSAAIATNTVTDLNAEAVLDPTIRPIAVPFEYVNEPNSILLTGATGFLGAHLLHELLEHTPADIYCLIRSPNTDEGKKRLQSKLESYSLWNETFSSRIIPVIGELSEPLLGLSEQQFQHLASQLDVIYHNGAWVNFIYPYSKLKAANVLGTQEVLRLASLNKVKPVHFVSTLSVFSSSAYSEGQVVRESDSLDYSQDLHEGYDQSKWVAEKLVMIARDRGLPVSIYRPGRITGHSRTGVSNTDDLLCRIIKGFIQLGSAPILDTTVDMTPVNYVSQAIVHLSQQKASLGKNFHLANPRPIPCNDLVNGIRSLGYPLEQISYDKWQAEVIERVGSYPENALHPLLPLLFKKSSEERTLFQERELQYDCQNTFDGLAGTDIVCPTVNTELLATYFSYFMGSGFLNG